MENWFEKIEQNNDERRERELNYLLEGLLSKYERMENENIENENQKIKVLDKIIEIYHTLKVELFEYDANDYLEKKKMLEDLRYKKMQKDHQNSSDFKSWEEYKEEEQNSEERE